MSLRDAYERLYRYESLRREQMFRGEHLNTCYDRFVMRYGNLSAKQNVKLVMMDAGGRDVSFRWNGWKTEVHPRRTSSSICFLRGGEAMPT